MLVAGFATRHVVQSAYRAGYEVYAIDHFCDQDLCWYTKEHTTYEELDELPDLITEWHRRYKTDALVVTSGAEDIHSDVPVQGSSPECATKFLDKLSIQHHFEDLGIPIPPVAEPREYPVMIKPCRGAGGWRNQIVHSEEEEAEWHELWPEVPSIRQKIITGTPASVSCISNGREARAIAVNMQILRGGEGDRAYGFGGDQTPFDTSLGPEMVRYAEKAVAASGCVGSVGVDFVINDHAWAIEINPRFQATLDTVEMATGCHIFDLHLDACKGRIPSLMPVPKQYAIREIIFAEHDLVVRSNLKDLAPAIADIPFVGTEIEEGGALLSAYGHGPTPEAARKMLDKTISGVSRYMTRW